MKRPRQHAPRSTVPPPDVAITFLRSLAAPQRQAFVARMRQKEFAAWVRTIVEQVSQASIVEAHPCVPALARSMAHRLVAPLAPDEPLLLQLALHALLRGAHPVQPPPVVIESARLARSRDTARQRAREMEQARHPAVSAEPQGPRRAGGTAPPS